MPPELKLTAKQMEIANLVADGKTTKEIAFILKISPHTVKAHKNSIGQRLGLTGLPGRGESNLAQKLATWATKKRYAPKVELEGGDGAPDEWV